MGPAGGGAEAWLMQVMRHMDRERFHNDFVVHTPEPQAYHDELRALGCNVFPCVRPLYLWKYPRCLRAVLRQNGPYDIAHVHVLFSGLALRQARQVGIPVRIAHSHSDRRGFAVDNDILRGSVVRWTNRWIHRDASLGLACSRRAAAALFGPRWETDPRWQLLYIGIDLSRFQRAIPREVVRAGLGLPNDAWVVGHVGRFQEQKNHALLIDIFAELVARDDRFRLVLIGDGPLRPAIERKVARAGLAGHVHFAGVRSDVPQVMQGALDVILLPSHYEGLPLVGIECQAAGLPAVVSDVIATDMDVVPGLIHRVSLSEPPSRWADVVWKVLRAPRTISAAEALRSLENSPFNIHHCVRSLEAIYSQAVVPTAFPGPR
jgi:glycosyltransferase involved in cell wall biosynthesis